MNFFINTIEIIIKWVSLHFLNRENVVKYLNNDVSKKTNYKKIYSIY